MNTEELVEKCIRRNKFAWNEFVRQYESLVRRAVNYKLNKMNAQSMKSDLDDIVQDVFLMFLEDNKLSKLKDISCLKSWLVIVTLNKTTSYCTLRWKEDRKTRSLNEDMTEEGFTLEDLIPSKALDPRESLETKEIAERIRDCVKMLKEKERKALELNLYDCKKHRDIAKIMDIPVSTISSLITRAKGKVREGIKEYCVS